MLVVTKGMDIISQVDLRSLTGGGRVAYGTFVASEIKASVIF